MLQNKKQRDKKSDRSSRRSESERRKERSTPKKSTSQSQASSTPAQPSAQPTPPQHPQSQHPAPQQQAPQQQSGQMQSNQQQALQLQQQQQQQQQHHQHQQSMMPRDSAASDSDLSEDGRMKKHSIFDIVDDEPAYISMYDKVKARSTKNMQKQEEEKQKEKLKEKFNQLKQSRAKREEKKRSTSWDEDSDSDGGHHHHHKQLQERSGKTPKRPGKLVITSSSEEEGHNSRRRLLSDISHTDKSESDAEVLSRNKQRKSKLLKSELEGSDEDNEEGSARTKLMHAARRNFKPKITSDTSDYDEAMQQQQQQQKYKPAFDIYSDSDDKQHHAMSTPVVAKVKTKENSRETFESSDEGKFDNKKHYDLAKFKHEFSENEAPNCIDKQPRKSHKSKRRPSGKSNCVEQPQLPVDDLEVRLERIDDAKLRLDHKRPSEEKQATPQPSGIDHKRSSAEPATNEYKRSSTESEHKRHSSSRRERRRSGHHEDKDETEAKASSRARKKKSKKDAVAKQEPSSKQRDDKMEDIFGPISDDSETGTANPTFHTEQSTTKSSNAANNNNNTQTYNPCPRKWQFNSVYSSDSDSNVDNAVIHRTSPSLPQLPEFEVENFGALDVNTSLKRSEERRRKRERRRSKERREKRLQREIRAERTDEELAEAGRVLESQLQTECSPPPPPPVPPPPVMPRLDEFRFTDDESASAESCERPKEKKKKRKRSKEERSRKDHHEKSSKSSESERKSSRGSEEPCSLPNLLPSPTSPAKVFSPEAKSFPKHFDDDDTLPVTEAAPSKPLVEKKRPDMKLIPGFGSEVDANIHETAVQSISSFPEEPVPIPEPAPTPPVVLLCPEPEEKEDKPRTVISQEETEDAVAALLEEKFDFAHYIDDGDDEEAVPHELHQEHVEPVLAAVQDEEQLASEEAQKETQQAVQSLECELPTAAVAPVVTEPVPEEESKDAERADTPQSEHDLQIDESAQPCSEDEAPVSPPPMPTLEQEEIEEPVSCPSPDTPEMMDFSRPPKTPDFPAAYYQQQQQQQQQLEASLETSLEKPVEEKLVVKEEQEVKETVVETPVVQPVTEVVKPPPSPEPLKPVEKPTEEPEVKKEVEVVPEPVKKVEEPELKVPEIIIPKEVVEEKVVEEKVVETIVPVLPEVEEKPVPPVEVPVEPVKPEVKIEVTPPEPSPPVAPVAPILQKAEELVEVKKEVVEPETVTPALLEVPQSPLRVRKVELSAPLIRDLAAQALQEAAAITPVPVPQAPATPVAAEEHEVPSHTEDETEEKVGETINTRCITRRGGRSRRGSKAVSRGGVSTRRTARGGGRTPRSDTAELSHTEESAEEKSGDITSPEHSQRGRKSRRGRKKKSVEPESGDDKGKSKMSSDTNDIYEFHDTDDEDLHYKSKPGEKIPVPAATVPTTTVSPPTPVKVDEAPTVAPTPPAPEEPVPEVPQHRRDSTTDDAASRPRLILTIKSPLKEGAAKVETREEFEQVAPPEVAATLVPAEPQATVPSPTPTIQQSPQPSHVAMNVKSPPGPTRKSRRLQEKDSSRSTVDDIIEEVIKGNFRAEEGGATSPMHEARGGVTTRRSGRGTRLQRGSEEPQVPPRTARASSLTRPEEEKQQQQPVAPPSVAKIELPKPAVAAAPSPTALPPQPQQQAQSAPPPSQKPQTAPVRVSPPVPRRAEEPTTLIDPVTGLLTPMRESGEGQYIPVTTSVSVIQAPPPASQQEHVVRPLVVKVEEKKAAVPVVRPPETPAQPPMQQQAPRPPAPQSPQRVPSATVAPAPRLVPPPPQVQRPVQQVSPTVVKLFNATTTAPPPTPAITVVQQPVVVSRPPVTATYTAPPRVVSEMGPGAPYPPWPTQAAPHTSPSRMSPLQQQTVAARVTAAPPQAHIPMAHASSLPSKQHLMESSSAQPPQPQGARPCLPQPAHSASAPERREHRRAKELTRRSLAEEELPLSMLPPRLRVGAVARTSAAAALPAPACSNTSAVAEPPRVEVGLGGCIVASGAPAQPRPPRARSRESPVGGGRPSMGHTATHSQVLQAGLPVPAYEASLGESVRVSPGQHAAAAAAAAAGFAPVAHLQQRPHDMAAQLLHNQQQFIYHQQLLRAQHEQQQLGPPPPSSAYHHQPYHLPPGPPGKFPSSHCWNLGTDGDVSGAARSPAVPGLDVKAEPPEASDEALALGPRGSRAPPSPPLELRRSATNARLAAAHLHSPHDRTTDSPQVATVYGARLVHHPHQGFQPRVAENDKLHAAPPLQPHRSNYMAPPQHPRYEEEGIFHHAPPPPAHHQRGVRGGHPTPGQEAPLSHPAAALQQPRLQVQTPPHASQVPPQADSLLMLLQRYPVVWQGLLALKNDQAAVQMHFVHGNPHVARNSLPCNSDGSTPPLRIAQRMRLEQTQLEGVARKMQMEQEHCMLLALPCGRDHMDVLQQSNNLKDGFITYLQQKQAAGIVNIPLPGSQQAAYVIHIFPSSDFANDNLARIAPDLLHRVSELSHLLIIIATV
ncbi:hypothetical protein B566_EDAN002937 [Ephemera danica]|nr:hypothetical protein B566_EDAN002937 [Ephemera danica]